MRKTATCIVALRQGDTFVMGGDSASIDPDTTDYSILGRLDPKVFTNGEFVIGFAGSYRVGQLIRYKLNVPPPDESEEPHAYIATAFVDEYQNMLEENKALAFDPDMGTARSEGLLLVGYRGHIFEIDSDFQVGESFKNYAAIGCGAPYALGALYATEHADLALSARERVELALETAARFSAGVSGPFTVLEVPIC